MELDLMFFSEGTQNSSETAQFCDSEENAESANTAEETSPDEEFEELIKGKYADAFNKRTKSIIDKRLRKMKGFEETVRVLTPLLESISADFPDIDKNDTGGLINAFLEKKNRLIQAENRKKENSVLFQRAEEHIKKRAAEKVKAVLLEESEKLKEIYPSFDLQREYASSPELRSLLAAGVGLRRAFETVNLEKIMGTALRYAVMKAEKNTADAMKNSARVTETSLASGASSLKRTDVKNLTEKEIMKIISEVSKGAKISF